MSDLQALIERSAEAGGTNMTLEELNHVISFLHQSGFHDAETALLREVETKFPDHRSSSAGVSQAEEDHLSLTPSPRSPPKSSSTIDLCPPAVQNHSPIPAVDPILGSAEKVLEAWRSKSATPAASPRKANTPRATTPTSPPKSIPSPSTPGYSDVDEYDDDEDVGFWRMEFTASSEPAGTAFAAAALAAVDAVDGNNAASNLPGQDANNNRRPGIVHTPSSSYRSGPFSCPNSLEPPPLMEPVLAPGAAPYFSSHKRQLSTTSSTGLLPQINHPPSSPPGENHNNALLQNQRQAGTAQWVFDPANSAGSDAYKSLMHFLDPASPKYEDASKKASSSLDTALAAQGSSAVGGGSSSRQGMNTSDMNELWGSIAGGSSLQNQPSEELPLLAEDMITSSGQFNATNTTGTGGERRRGRSISMDVGHVGEKPSDLSRVSSLSESILQDFAATGIHQDDDDTTTTVNESSEKSPRAGGGLMQGTVGEEIQPLSPGTITTQDEDTSEGLLYNTTSGTRGGSPNAGDDGDVSSASPKEGNDHHLDDGMTATPPNTAVKQHVSSPNALGKPPLHEQRRPLPALRTPFALDKDSEDMDDSAGTPPSNAKDAVDPFSFQPIASPVAEAATTATTTAAAAAPLVISPTGPLFGSGNWASFHNATSADRKAGFGYGSGTEDESASQGTRSLQRPPRAASSIGRSPSGSKLLHRVHRTASYAQLAGASATAAAAAAAGLGTPRGNMGHYDDMALYEYDQEMIEHKYEVTTLKLVHAAHTTGFQHTREMPLRINDLIAGRYQILDLLGQAAFSRAVQALDLKTGALVCLKVVKNNKDYFDQSLDEIRLLKYVNGCDPNDEYGVLQLFDFFYFKEHLFLVCELLRANLYEFAKYNRESGDALYFTPRRIASVARQVPSSLTFLHSLGLVHADLKPENILMKSYSNCQVKVIDLGSSCFVTDQLSPYVQSRSYRAPEVILGVSYDQKIDVWSLGCIVAELANGKVLFQNTSLPTLLARMEGILGPLPRWMLQKGRFTHRYYTREGRIYEQKPAAARYEYLRPKRTTLARRLPEADPGLIDFLAFLLQPDPNKRPTAEEALHHPWLQTA